MTAPFQIHLHQTHHPIGDFESIFTYIKDNFGANRSVAPLAGPHIFPELFLTGYPLLDLCLQRPFIERYLNFIEQLNNWSQQEFQPLKSGAPLGLFLGGLQYTFDAQNYPAKIENAIFLLVPGMPLKHVYSKMLLPNYDIFDEKKYFSPGSSVATITFAEKNIALMICEDMWPSTLHTCNPVHDLQQIMLREKRPFDFVINLSASPYHVGKLGKRLERAKEISHTLAAPFFYCNRVGGEDEILFDGGSFAVNGEKVLGLASQFTTDLLSLELPGPGQYHPPGEKTVNTWESLFEPRIKTAPATMARLREFSPSDCEEIVKGLCFGLQEYAVKTGHRKFLVAISGGLDSSLVAVLAKLSLAPGQVLESIFMPSQFTSSLSYTLASQLARGLEIKMHTLPIKFLHSTVRNAYNDNCGEELNGLADENVQSRLRGLLLYAKSNRGGFLVLNTSNKSELAVGYSTIYGDSVGALALLGDLYKTEVFQLARYINHKYGPMIPEEIISRPPTAELRKDQKDSDSLPPYERLDPILEGILSYRLSLSDLSKMGLPQEEIERTYRLYLNSEYKRKQFSPIIKLKPKSFGFGYRVPICKKMI
ncbi:MAG: NAD(+) synthase [Bdellovibrionales bacterium GWA2_49_15]|nr:MAG: NAD(+) synthase [Bdellovibrionales bacterium GWA2_49_15]HAZ11783.1 NAD(+) synthase [Bdellovibrionales bacterium]